MDTLESAVLICLNPRADKTVKEQALQYCQSIRNASDGWVFVLQHLSISSRPQVSFWCFQVLHETLSNSSQYPAKFSSDHVLLLRGKILDYFSKAVYPEKYSNGSTADASSLPPFLLNKLAQIVVSLVAVDYPHSWPGAFQDTILPLVKSPQTTTDSSTSMFFRVMRALDEDIASIRATQISENHRVTSIRVKDAMRDDCILDIITKCAEFLGSPSYVSAAFDIISRYVEWVDIGLIVQERILRPMYAALTTPSECKARPAAAAALRSIVLKRMDSQAKVNMLKALNIESLLQSIPVNIICRSEEEQSDPDLNLHTGQVEVAALVNTVAMTALDILKAATKSNNATANDPQIHGFVANVAQLALPLALRFMDEDAEEGTSSQTLQCVTTYVNVFAKVAKNSPGTNSEGFSAMAAILKVVEERSLMPTDFDPQDDKAEDHRSLSELRNILVKSVFMSVVRSFPEMCVEFVNALFVRALNSGDVSCTELSLTTLVGLTATAPETAEIIALRRKVISSPPACMSFSSSIPIAGMNKMQIAQQHQLELVSTTYFDLVARSYRLFLTLRDPTLLSAVLPVFFDNRGLGHQSSESIRSHAAYSLLKLCRPLRSVFTPAHVDAVLNAARSHLFPVHENVNCQASKNQMLIFETVGYLLGADHKREEYMRYFSALLEPLIEGLGRNPGVGALPYIMASGYLSKGVGGDSKPLLLLLNEDGKCREKDSVNHTAPGHEDGSGKEVKLQRVSPLTEEMQQMWIMCLKAVLKASSISSEVGKGKELSELRGKLVFFLHRMVDTVGVGILPYLEQVLPALLKSCDTPLELRDVIILASQAITKFGEAFEGVAMRVYVPIVEQVHRHSFTLDALSLMVISEDSREAVEMHRAYTYFLHAVIGSKLIGLLLHPLHSHVMHGVMSSLLASAIGEALDIRVAASIMKMSLHMLGEMVERWCGVDEGGSAVAESPNGFSGFAIEKISRATVASGVKGTVFRYGDYESGQAISVLTEIVSVQRRCAVHLGRGFGEALLSDAFCGLPRPMVDLYLSSVYSKDTAIGALVPRLVELVKLLRAN